EAALPVTVEHPAFDEWWRPFTLGVGPAGAYFQQLEPAKQQELEQRLREQLGEPVALETRAWAARGIARRPQHRRPLLTGLAPPAPCAALGTARLDDLLEAIEVGFDTAQVEPGRGAEQLGRPFRLVAHRQSDERLAFRPRLESDGATRLLPVLADPGDLPVRMLLQDLRVPLGLLAAD